MKFIVISDPTLRDGNHAIKHQMSLSAIEEYCTRADAAGIPIVEVGHGNGQGASSLQLGESAWSDVDMLRIARKCLREASLGIHIIPGFGTIERDLKPALDEGVDVVRVASHVTEADLCERHIRFVNQQHRRAYGALMMSHLADLDTFVIEAKKLESYGADGVVFYDSAGHYLPNHVRERVQALTAALKIPVGFHGHNNLGLAVANTTAAVEAGAVIVDATILGFGAGAGNTQLEVLATVLDWMNHRTNIDLDRLYDLADYAKTLGFIAPSISSTSIVSGVAGVFSGFAKPVQRAAEQYSVSPRAIFRELGRRRVVAGQEDLIVEVAAQLAKETK